MSELSAYEGTATIEKVAALARRRGFVYPSSDIYGGLGSSYDYGHYGVLLKQNVKSAWQRALVQERDDVVLLDSAIILNPEVWVASGHVGGFSDPLVDCRACKLRFRADHLDQSACGRKPSRHPGETPECDLTEAREFNLMFETQIGPVRDEASRAYLRPETAQGIFVEFKNVIDTTRVKVPFGIAQVGKAFRNEVTPRNFTFRSREFEQMEIEFFCHPSEAREWYAFWRAERMRWWQALGLAGENLQLREHEAQELAHYAREGAGTADVEYRFPFTAPGFGELEGIAHRADFDLAQHQKHSRSSLEYFDAERGELLPNGARKGERYLPHVIEPSAGLDRGVLAVLCEAYLEDPARASPELLLLSPRLAPIKAAIFPLVNKDGMPEVSEKLYLEVRRRFWRRGLIEHDVKQAIGKRYARMDEAGCPFCFTIDGETLKDQTVTVRDRNTARQERIALDHVVAYLEERLGAG